MNTLKYTQVQDIQRVLSENQLTRIVSSEYGEAVVDYDTVPADPFADPLWSSVATALIAAENEVEAMLGHRYELPVVAEVEDESGNVVEVVPEILRVMVLTYAKYRLFQRSPREIPDSVEDQYNDANVFLRRVARGDASIPGVNAKERRRVITGKRTKGIFGNISTL